MTLSTEQVDGCYHLKTFLNIAGPDVLSVGAGPEAQSVLKRMEREATHRYQTLTLPEDRAANCMFVNGTLVHRGRQEAPKSQPVSLRRKFPLKCKFMSFILLLLCQNQVFSAKIDLPRVPVSISEFSRSNIQQRPISSLFILIRKSKHVRKL